MRTRCGIMLSFARRKSRGKDFVGTAKCDGDFNDEVLVVFAGYASRHVLACSKEFFGTAKITDFFKWYSHAAQVDRC